MVSVKHYNYVIIQREILRSRVSPKENYVIISRMSYVWYERVVWILDLCLRFRDCEFVDLCFSERYEDFSRDEHCVKEERG